MGSSYGTCSTQCPTTGQSRRRPATPARRPFSWAPPVTAIDQSSIVQVYPPIYSRNQVWISWQSTAPQGTWWQVYFDGVRVWSGQKTKTWILRPPNGVARVVIGSVPAGYQDTSFSATLPSAPLRRATLTWTGGTSLGADLAGFYVYGSAVPNGPVSYASPLATITAYPQSIVPSGTPSYSWVSASLTSGNWSYAVIPFDSAGNQGTPSLVTVTIAVPPLEPGPPATVGSPRLNYTYSQPSKIITLGWLPSPSA